MKTFVSIVLLLVLSISISACTGPVPAPNLTPRPSATPAVSPLSPTTAPLAATATPIGMIRTNPEQSNRPQTRACNLITQQDVAGFFSGEVSQPLYASNHSQQVIFPAESVSAIESYCLYMAFHLPSSKKGTYNQLTYWVDTADNATPAQWARIWEEGKSHAEQTISGVGDDAFYVDGRLTFKKGSTYVTIEVLSTGFDTKTQAGKNQQIDIEKKAALTALSRMP